jgi:hypothetical protein
LEAVTYPDTGGYGFRGVIRTSFDQDSCDFVDAGNFGELVAELDDVTTKKIDPQSFIFIHDDIVGTGSVAAWGDSVLIRYQAHRSAGWHIDATDAGISGEVKLRLGDREGGVACETAVEGMRVGGRRTAWVAPEGLTAKVQDHGSGVVLEVELRSASKGN